MSLAKICKPFLSLIIVVASSANAALSDWTHSSAEERDTAQERYTSYFRSLGAAMLMPGRCDTSTGLAIEPFSHDRGEAASARCIEVSISGHAEFVSVTERYGASVIMDGVLFVFQEIGYAVPGPGVTVRN